MAHVGCMQWRHFDSSMWCWEHVSH